MMFWVMMMNNQVSKNYHQCVDDNCDGLVIILPQEDFQIGEREVLAVCLRCFGRLGHSPDIRMVVTMIVTIVTLSMMLAMEVVVVVVLMNGDSGDNGDSVIM